MTVTLTCDMETDCTEPVTMIDCKGFAYCTAHGLTRRDPYWGNRCRKLRPHELRRLQSGRQVARY